MLEHVSRHRALLAIHFELMHTASACFQLHHRVDQLQVQPGRSFVSGELRRSIPRLVVIHRQADRTAKVGPPLDFNKKAPAESYDSRRR